MNGAKGAGAQNANCLCKRDSYERVEIDRAKAIQEAVDPHPRINQNGDGSDFEKCEHERYEVESLPNHQQHALPALNVPLAKTVGVPIGQRLKLQKRDRRIRETGPVSA